MTLLDKNRKFYSFDRKEEWSFVTHATSTIYDENGNKIGRLQGEGTFRKKVSLIDTKGESLLTVKKGTVFDIKSDYTIFDGNKNNLGIVALRSRKNEDVHFMVDKNKNTILNGRGPYKGDIYGIGDKNKKIVATFSFPKQKGWKNWFSGTERCNLEIQNLEFNRLELLGLFISMFSRFYDISPKGGEGG